MNYRVFVGLFLKEDGKEVFLNVIIYYKYNMNINIIKINRKKITTEETGNRKNRRKFNISYLTIMSTNQE